MTDRSHKDRIVAAAVTLTVMVAVVVILCVCALTFPPKDWEERHPPEEESELLFGGEYVMLGELPIPSDHRTTARHPDAEPDGPDMTDAGAAGDPEPILTSDNAEVPDVAVQPEETAKPGPTAEELAREETRRRVGQRMNFGKSSAAAEGRQGSRNGNSTTGAVAGQPGFNLRGRRLLNHATPADRNATGTVVVAISVDRSGHVTSAKASGGTPTASSKASVRRACEQASLQLLFSASDEAPAIQEGTVTWLFD